MKPQLVIMVKAPRMGRAKTRLAKQVGAVNACQFARLRIDLIVRQLKDPRWQIRLAVAPDVDDWPWARLRGVYLLSQGQGDLGTRMQRQFEMGGAAPMVMVGADIPDIRKRHIEAAFQALQSKSAAFGPATDGGYYLVGFKRCPKMPRAFENVRWSTEHALQDTLANLKGSYALLEPLSDVDDADSYYQWRGQRA